MMLRALLWCNLIVSLVEGVRGFFFRQPKFHPLQNEKQKAPRISAGLSLDRQEEDSAFD